MEPEAEELRNALKHGQACIDNYFKIGVPAEQVARALQRLIHAAEQFQKAKS